LQISLIQAPYDSGHQKVRMRTGAQKVVQAGIKKELANAGHEVHISSIHGEAGNGQVVYLGGADTMLGAFIRRSLKAYGFQVEEHANPLM
jgi:phage replication-related protein YjqB (UPF0714/DUF867 family)